MAELSDATIQAYVDQLLPEIQQSGRSPKDVECTVTRAVLNWMEDHTTPTLWLSYELDGHKFMIRRNEYGRVAIGKEL